MRCGLKPFEVKDNKFLCNRQGDSDKKCCTKTYKRSHPRKPKAPHPPSPHPNKIESLLTVFSRTKQLKNHHLPTLFIPLFLITIYKKGELSGFVLHLYGGVVEPSSPSKIYTTKYSIVEELK